MIPGDDPRWEALAWGTLSDDEVHALHAEAMRTQGGRDLWDLYAPFTPDEDERLVRGLEERLGGARDMSQRAAVAFALALLVSLAAVRLIVPAERAVQPVATAGAGGAR